MTASGQYGLLAKDFVFSTGNPRDQWAYCGTPDTSVDFPTPPPDTDTKQIQLVRTTFLGKPQVYRVSALFSCSRFTHHMLVIVFINIYGNTAYAKGATPPESVTRSVSKMLSATISGNWHSDCSWSLDADSPKGASVPFPEI
ncbi:MAG TPA: hypothetical protein VGK96_23045 [Candidatus Sulfotelmatobacter sp.]